MSWENLLSSDTGHVLPWLGGRRVHSRDRTWTIKGRLPPEFGWYTFQTSGGRDCCLKGAADRDPSYQEGHQVVRGFLVGNRLIADDARVDPDPGKIIGQTEEVYCVDPGLDRFQKAATVRDREGRLIFMNPEWPEGPEMEVLAAYQDRKNSVAGIKGVTPALDLAFRWLSYQRAEDEARAAERIRLHAEEEARLAEHERLHRLMGQVGTAEGRRATAVEDFPAAARAALAVSGAELLDVLSTHNPNEMRVQYRFRNRRLECVVHKTTLRIIIAGVCLTDGGVRGDTLFTLESLPGVIGEAIDTGQLHINRHIDDDRW